MELGRQPKQTVPEQAPTNQLSCNRIDFDLNSWQKSECVCM